MKYYIAKKEDRKIARYRDFAALKLRRWKMQGCKIAKNRSFAVLRTWL